MDWNSQETLDTLLVETTTALEDIVRKVHGSPMSIGQKYQVLEYCKDSKDQMASSLMDAMVVYAQLAKKMAAWKLECSLSLQFQMIELYPILIPF